MYRYLEILDTLFDAIIDDIRSESFSVSDKYKAKQEELGKHSIIHLHFLISLFHHHLTNFI